MISVGVVVMGTLLPAVTQRPRIVPNFDYIIFHTWLNIAKFPNWNLGGKEKVKERNLPWHRSNVSFMLLFHWLIMIWFVSTTMIWIVTWKHSLAIFRKRKCVCWWHNPSFLSSWPSNFVSWIHCQLIYVLHLIGKLANTLLLSITSYGDLKQLYTMERK